MVNQTGGQSPMEWNILVLSSDQHNAKLMGCAGHPIIKTPALDRLAREGTMFTKAYCPFPSCAPTRQSFITGRHPKEHGQLSDSYVFDRGHTTLAHHFANHGYKTACIGKMHTNHEAFGYGYDYRLCSENFPEELLERAKLKPPYMDPNDEPVFEAMTDNKYWSDKSRLYGMVAQDEALEHDGMVTDDAVRYLREHRNDKFFLHVSLVKPHYPWISPREYYSMYEPEGVDLPPAEPSGLEHNYMGRKKSGDTGWHKNTYEQNRLCRARYYGCISWMDSNMGRILDCLDELDLNRNTLVVYFSDHGDMAGEKGLWLKTLMYDSSVRVPLIVRMPGVVPAGAKSDQLINHVDLFPTLAGLVGATEGMPDDVSGTELSEVVCGSGEGPAYTFSMEGIKEDWDTLPDQLMVRSSKWKFIRYQVDDPDHQHVLYDMENDSEEIANLAYEPAYSEVVERHLTAMHRFVAGLDKPAFALRKKSS